MLAKIEGVNYTAIIGESAKIDVKQAINYIKSGQAEISETVGDIIGEFNDNAVEKTNTFNQNAIDKTAEFDLNASNKTTDFNNNYLEKKALIDAEVQVAKDWATKTDGTVDGVDYSAKYYAQSILPIKDDITAVAGIATDVSDVADIKDEVTAVANDKANIDAVGSNIANVNTVAGDHANIQAVINNMTAINNAPTYANNSKIWAEGLDGEVAPLGGTHSARGWAQIAEAAASGVQNPANRDLSNLTNTGQMIIDSQNGTISNCILEIPHTFNVTLENNVVTVKSGSTFVLTGSTYATRTLTADKTVDLTSRSETKVYILMSASDSIVPWFNYENTGSVTTLPADNSQYLRVFNVTDKQYYLWSDADNAFTVWGQNLASYPLCVVEKVNGVWQFAKDSNGNDMIFNGAGFIGHHAFVYPNVKGLYPNGFNADGTLKSGVAQTNALYIREMDTGQAYTGYNRRFSLNGNGQVGVWRAYKEIDNLSEGDSRTYFRNYVKNENLIYNGTGNGYNRNSGDIECTPFIEFYYNGTTVTDFTIRQPYEGARNLLTDDIEKQVEQNTANIATKANISSLSTVATSGSYNDLTDKPTIPTKTSDLTNDSGYITGTTAKTEIIQDDTTPQIRIACDDLSVRTTVGCDTNGAFLTYLGSTQSSAILDGTKLNLSIGANSVDLSASGSNLTVNGDVVTTNTKLATLFTSMTGYDSTKTQTLKNINGVLTWVTD